MPPTTMGRAPRPAMSSIAARACPPAARHAAPAPPRPARAAAQSVPVGRRAGSDWSTDGPSRPGLRAAGLEGEVGGGELALVRVADVEQVVAHRGALGGGGLVGADVHAAVHLAC